MMPLTIVPKIHNLNPMRFFISLFLMAAVSCDNSFQKQRVTEAIPDHRSVRLNLIGNLAGLALDLPIQYDTAFLWTHLSDCTTCDEQKYRYQPKALPIFKEDGFYWTEPKDSVDRLTISHKLSSLPYEGDTGKQTYRLNNLKGRLSADPHNPSIVFDTIEKIHDRYFYIVAMDSGDSIQFKKVVAVTTARSNEIMFSYELKTAKRDSTVANFIKTSLYFLRTIRISKGV